MCKKMHAFEQSKITSLAKIESDTAIVDSLRVAVPTPRGKTGTFKGTFKQESGGANSVTAISKCTNEIYFVLAGTAVTFA